MKTKSHTLLLLASMVMAASLACLAGCGGAGETSATKPRSSAEEARSLRRLPAETVRFLERGNAICRRADAEQRMLARRYLAKGSVAQRWELVPPAVTPAMAKELQELKDLTPPKGDEAKTRRILKAMQKGVEDAKDDPLDLIYTESDPFREMRALAKRYGLTVCAFSSHVVIQPREE